MRILITGAGGLLGGRLCTLLSANHQTMALVRRQPAPEEVAAITAELTDGEALTSAFDRARPEAVIHAAALADAEICEQDQGRARRENEVATRALAAACHRAGSRLISISTDLVFGGDVPLATETFPTAPVMEYGRSKLRAEEAAVEECPDAVILRVALICGRGHGARLSASESIAQRLRRGETVALFEDEWRTPIDPESVAEAIHAVLLRTGTRGRLHIGGAERLTRLEMGERVAEALGLNPSLLRKAPQSSHRGAPRPRDVSLDIGLAAEQLGWTPRPLEVSIREGRQA